MISIIMSVRNGDDYLQEAIDSILKQTYKNFEFIIVDDFSTDKTRLILSRIKDKRIKVITNKVPKGLTKSLNIALRQSKGELIARMDADDISRKDRLQLQAIFLKNNPNTGVVGSWAEVIDKNGNNISLEKFPAGDTDIKENIFIFNPFKHPSVTFRKHLVDTLGYYDEGFDGAEDYEMWLRLAPHTKFANIPKPLISYRIHNERVSEKEERKVLLQALRVRLKAVKEYAYPKSNLIYMIVPIISYFIPAIIKKYLRKFFLTLSKLLIKLIQKTAVLTSLGMRFVKITGKYSEAVHPKHLTQTRKTWFLNYINSRDTVLDIGCNNGQNTMKAARRCLKVIAFDNDKKLLKIAEKDVKNRGITNITLLVHNAENKLPFKSSLFNVIMFFAVLEHLVNRDKAITEVYRVLKPGGKLLLSVPNSNTTWKNIQKKAGLPYFADSDHKLEYQRDEIISFLTAHHFKVKRCEPVALDMPFIGVIDFLGGLSLSLYKFVSQLRRNLVFKYPNETVSFEILAIKEK